MDRHGVESIAQLHCEQLMEASRKYVMTGWGYMLAIITLVLFTSSCCNYLIHVYEL
jgi:hypothetical protein